MAKKIEAYSWTSAFRELLTNESKVLDIDQYDFCLNEWKGAHDKKMIKIYLLAILLFCAGLWAVWENSLFTSVLLIGLAANFNRQSSHHILISELMGSQRLLAMLINKQAQQIKSLQKDRISVLDES